MHYENWYGYIYPKNIELMKTPKILTPDIANNASFALDESGDYAFTSGYGIVLDKNYQGSNRFILGLLNSRLLDFYLKNISTTMRGGYFRYFSQFLEKLPIRPIDFKNKVDVNMHDRMVELVTRILDLNKKLAANSTPADKEFCKRRIDATDAEIDALVYKLYDLTDEEIKLVEEKN